MRGTAGERGRNGLGPRTSAVHERFPGERDFRRFREKNLQERAGLDSVFRRFGGAYRARTAPRCDDELVQREAAWSGYVDQRAGATDDRARLCLFDEVFEEAQWRRGGSKRGDWNRPRLLASDQRVRISTSTSVPRTRNVVAGSSGSRAEHRGMGLPTASFTFAGGPPRARATAIL